MQEKTRSELHGPWNHIDLHRQIMSESPGRHSRFSKNSEYPPMPADYRNLQKVVPPVFFQALRTTTVKSKSVEVNTVFALTPSDAGYYDDTEKCISRK